MNCETCETQLLDLLYGELDTASTARVREHIEGCASCRAAEEKLATARRIVRQLPLEQAPAHVHSALMAHARAHTRGEVLVATPARKGAEERDEPQGPLQRLAAWLGGFLLGPQVAMAMVLMLVVGVGLYYLPGLRSPRNVPGGAIVNADPGDEVGPSAAIQPAEPLNLRLDTRTNRIHSGENGVVGRTGVRADAPATTRTAAELAANRVEGEAVEGPLPAPPSATLAALDAPADLRPTSPDGQNGRVVAEVIEETATNDGIGGELALAPGEAFGAGGGGALRQAPAATQQRGMAYAATGAARPAVDDVAMQRRAPADEAVGGAPSAVQQGTDREAERQVIARAEAPAPAPPPAAPAAPVARQPMQAVAPSRNAPAAPSGGSAAGAGNTSPQTQAQSPLLAAAGLHGVARNQARAGSTRDAIASYESLLSRYPGYDRSTEAMLELAELYRGAGDISRARSWLARAEQVPAYAARARQQRFRIDQMDRARTAVPPSAASSGSN